MSKTVTLVHKTGKTVTVPEELVKRYADFNYIVKAPDKKTVAPPTAPSGDKKD